MVSTKSAFESERLKRKHLSLALKTKKKSKRKRKTQKAVKEREASKHRVLTLFFTSPKIKESGEGERCTRETAGVRWVREPSRMIGALFEPLKCRREALSSPFRVTVHGGKGPVILLSLPHREFPRSSTFPPNKAVAPYERPANAARAALDQS